jgi:hypothetical protein
MTIIRKPGINVYQKYSTTGMEDEPDEWLGTSYDDSDNLVLHRFFDRHADKIGKELLSFSSTESDSEAVLAGTDAWRDVCALLVEVGSPVELPKLSHLSSDEHPEFQDLQERHKYRNTDSVSGIFFETSSPRVRPKSICFVHNLSSFRIISPYSFYQCASWILRYWTSIC